MNHNVEARKHEECPHCHKPIELSLSAVISLLALDPEPSKGATHEDDKSES